MALIQCPSCGHSISDKASRCPKCGGVVNIQTQQVPSYNANTYPVENMNRNNKGKKTALIIVSVIAAILAIVVVALVIHINKRPSYPPDNYTEDYYGDINDELFEDSESDLEDIINYSNEDLPEIIEEGMTMEKITLEGDYITYICSVDEDLYNISDIRAAQNEIKRNMKEYLIETDSGESDDFISLCKSNNKGVAFKYVGERTGNSHTIYIKPNEFQD